MENQQTTSGRSSLTLEVEIPAVLAYSQFPHSEELERLTELKKESNLPFSCYSIERRSLIQVRMRTDLFSYDPIEKTLLIKDWTLRLVVDYDGGNVDWHLENRQRFPDFCKWIIENNIVPHSFHFCTKLKYISKREWKVSPLVHLIHSHENIHSLHKFDPKKYSVKIVRSEETEIRFALVKTNGKIFYEWYIRLCRDGRINIQ